MKCQHWLHLNLKPPFLEAIYHPQIATGLIHLQLSTLNGSIWKKWNFIKFSIFLQDILFTRNRCEKPYSYAIHTMDFCCRTHLWKHLLSGKSPLLGATSRRFWGEFQDFTTRFPCSWPRANVLGKRQKGKITQKITLYVSFFFLGGGSRIY